MNEWPASKIEMRPINSLIPYARNYRKHNQNQIDKVAASIREFGWTIPVLIAEDSTIIAGHCRVLAAKKLGITEAPTMTAVGWSEAQRRAYVITDNQLTLIGENDEDLLRLELLDLKNSNFDLSLTGFDTKELDQLLVNEKSISIHEDEAPEFPSETTIKTGDLFILGNHRVLCGDNSDPENVKRLLKGEVPDACISDPPYGINATSMTMGIGESNKKKHNRLSNVNNWDNNRPHIEWLLDAFKYVCIWGGNYFANQLPISNDWLCWHKNNDGRSFSEFELAWTNYGNNCRHLNHHWGGERKLHITQKPIEVMAWSIQQSPKNSLVFDPFLGSGTTLMAAEQLGKRCFGMEIEPTYVQVIVDRWEKMSGQKAVLEKRDG